jgi:hypothetical protein
MPTCFVAMPIKKTGTAEHEHYRALYDEIVAPICVSAGYDVTRADDIQRAGAITRDIIVRIATADLVIADLTEINPNVFYEIGIRHSIRARGTVMILDEGQTPEVPFDLGAYRVIKFTREIAGLGRLRRDLSIFVSGMETPGPESDNPVHDWLPTLPPDVLGAATGSEEARLRTELASAAKRLREYEQAYGSVGNPETAGESPLNVVSTVLAVAREGALPSDLVERARRAVDQRDAVEYLVAVRGVMDSPSTRLSTREYLELAHLGGALGLTTVVDAIFQHAQQVHPKDTALRGAQLAHLAHSPDEATRLRARDEILRGVGVTVGEDGVTVEWDHPDHDDAIESELLGFALDTFHQEKLTDVPLSITGTLLTRNPDRSQILRYHARALDDAGRQADAHEYYRRSILVREPSDVSAVWFGNLLRRERVSLDCIEVYTLACKLDPEDASYYLRMADALVDLLRETQRGAALHDRPLPANLDINVVEELLRAAFSCEQLDQEDASLATRIVRKTDLGTEYLAGLVAMRAGGLGDGPTGIRQGRATFGERVALLERVYDEVKSSLTSPEADASGPIEGGELQAELS